MGPGWQQLLWPTAAVGKLGDSTFFFFEVQDRGDGQGRRGVPEVGVENNQKEAWGTSKCSHGWCR
jgi:hypothetical protein